jgi:DNA-binding transcriptional ArsR family regulator
MMLLPKSRRLCPTAIAFSCLNIWHRVIVRLRTSLARTGISVANASQHLQHLHRAGLVTARRDGKRRIYRLNSGVVELLAALRSVAEAHHAGSQQVIRAYFTARDSLEPVGHDELMARLAEGSVT